jgi:DNA-binding CsgD family transcriptional regulator
MDLFASCSAPYDAARARHALADALDALGRSERAARERARAQEATARLRGRREPASSALSARETDILRLVAQGLSDADIAGRLFLSPHTVHRHVANIRGKLRAPSRAAAVALASREGLL